MKSTNEIFLRYVPRCTLMVIFYRSIPKELQWKNNEWKKK